MSKCSGSDEFQGDGSGSAGCVGEKSHTPKYGATSTSFMTSMHYLDRTKRLVPWHSSMESATGAPNTSSMQSDTAKWSRECNLRMPNNIKRIDQTHNSRGLAASVNRTNSGKRQQRQWG